MMTQDCVARPGRRVIDKNLITFVTQRLRALARLAGPSSAVAETAGRAGGSGAGVLIGSAFA